MSLLSSIQGFGNQFIQTQPQQTQQNDKMREAKAGQMDVQEFVKSFSPQDLQEQFEVKPLDPMREMPGIGNAQMPTGRALDPGKAVSSLINEVDAARKQGAAMAHEVMAGESDNLHQSMIAMQEAGVAFNLMVEVRNKLMESYQELMRMSV